MVKKVLSVVTFALSVLFSVAMLVLAFETIRSYIYIKTSPESGIADLGLVFLILFLCLASLLGIITSALSVKFATYKAVKSTSCILLIVFIVVLIVCTFIIC